MASTSGSRTSSRRGGSPGEGGGRGGDGGGQGRPEATGYGCTYFVEEMLKHRKNGLKGKKVVVSGSGKVPI